MITKPLCISTYCSIGQPYDKVQGIPASHLSNIRILSDDPRLTSGIGTIDFAGPAQEPWKRASLMMETRKPVATDNSISSLSIFMKGSRK
jgi:hypothetical protein